MSLLTCGSAPSGIFFTANAFKPHSELQCPFNCPGTKAYYYIGWSPHNACVFAALNETSLELWNINTSIMEPVLTKKPGRK